MSKYRKKVKSVGQVGVGISKEQLAEALFLPSVVASNLPRGVGLAQHTMDSVRVFESIMGKGDKIRNTSVTKEG